MIYFVQSLDIGNAIRVLLRPPAGATEWRLLRKDTDDFSGHDDPSALLVHQGTETAVIDVAGLYNGLTVYYRAFYLVGAVWMPSASAAGKADATFTDLSADPLTVVRNRLDLGLQVYVDRGLLSHSTGHIPVMTASPLMEETPLPVVTLHVAADSSSERFIGDVLGGDVFNALENEWESVEGYLSRWQLTIVGWCLNADERMTLRAAMKAVLMGNLAVFDAAGMMQVDIQMSDTEDFQSYSAPIYMVSCTLTCVASSMVSGIDPAIRDVVVNPL